MNVLTDRKPLIAAAAFLFGAGVLSAIYLWLQSLQFAQPNPSALWSWSFESWTSDSLGAGGGVIRTVHEPIALFRNLALIVLATIGSAIGAHYALAIFGRGARPGNGADSRQVEATRRQLDNEASTIMELFQSQIEKNRSFSAALDSGHKNLAASKSHDQVRAVVQFLIAENKQMLRNNEDYEQKLQESRSQIESLRTALTKSQELTVRDSLTNAFSRRYFDETLANAVRDAKKSGTALSLVMADIDNFKRINDTYGHPIGDEVLKKFSEVMMDYANNGETVARYGGEEFAIILPTARVQEAASLAEQIRTKLESKHWVVKGCAPIGVVTASFGVAELNADDGPSDLIEQADAKLYRSKSAGRNRVSK